MAATQRRATRKSPERPGTGRRGVALPIVVTVLAGLGLLIAALRPGWTFDPIDFELPERSAQPPPVQQPSMANPAGTQTPPPPPPPREPVDLSWVPWVLLGLGIAVVAVVAALLIMRYLAWRQMNETLDATEPEIAESMPDLPTLQQGAARAEERLLAIGDPTDAIIAAWMSLQEAAEASGVHRLAAQTPTEFTSEVLSSTGVNPRPVRQLLQLYLRARFAAHPPEQADLESARQCVRDLAQSWQDFAASDVDSGPDTAPPEGRA